MLELDKFGQKLFEFILYHKANLTVRSELKRLAQELTQRVIKSSLRAARKRMPQGDNI